MCALRPIAAAPWAFAALISSLAAQAPAAPQAAPAAMAVQRDFVAITKQVMPSIVCVRTFVRDLPAAATPTGGAPPTPAVGWITETSAEREYPGFHLHGSGSGFLVGDGSDVLTALQPLRVGAEGLADVVEIEIATGQHILCEVVGIEPTLQLAVLHTAVHLSWDRPPMPPMQFADSETMELGSWLLAFGDPVGPERFLGMGLLAAKPARDCYQELLSAMYMQATLAVHPGAFGGPLVDLDGKCVGMLSRMELGGTPSPTSAWALPSKILQGLYESIRAAGTLRSPWLGISVMSRAEIAKVRGLAAFQALPKPKHGILLENVFDPSPAFAAGLRPGDFLTHMQDVEIHAPVDFQRQLYLAGVDRKVTLRLWRDGTESTQELTIAARPPEAKPK